MDMHVAEQKHVHIHTLTHRLEMPRIIITIIRQAQLIHMVAPADLAFFSSRSLLTIEP